MAKKMTNRQVAALETRRKLLETAKKLVCEKGLVNTSWTYVNTLDKKS